MTTFPLATLAATVTAEGISAPSYADVLASLKASFQLIYGADAYLEPDSQDGQLISVFAAAINDCNSAAIAVYNSFSPATAVGVGLSNVVKINGLRRLVPSNSSVDLTLVGPNGTEIVNGIVEDTVGHNQWLLPPLVTIGGSGSVVATATCSVAGAITAPAGTITEIVNPQRGWQSATNAADATVGAPKEEDGTLRQRQAVSTSLPAQTRLESIVSAVLNLSGVQVVKPYENDTGTTDGNGIPGHSIALVVVGGDSIAIATAIARGKSGTGTYGAISETIIDQNGVPDTVWFSRPTAKRVIASLSITALTGYVSTTGALIKAEMTAWVAALPIGGSVNIGDMFAAAKLPGALGATYKIEYGNLLIALFGNSPGTADLAMAWNEEAALAISDISLSVL